MKVVDFAKSLKYAIPQLWNVAGLSHTLCFITGTNDHDLYKATKEEMHIFVDKLEKRVKEHGEELEIKKSSRTGEDYGKHQGRTSKRPTGKAKTKATKRTS